MRNRGGEDRGRSKWEGGFYKGKGGIEKGWNLGEAWETNEYVSVDHETTFLYILC